MVHSGDADMLVAVTQSDSTNLVACKIARSVFNVTTRVARLRSADYLDDKSLLDDEHFAVTHAICPEQIVTEYIKKLIEFPEALQVAEFAGGKIDVVAVRATVTSDSEALELGTSVFDLKLRAVMCVPLVRREGVGVTLNEALHA